MDNRAKHMQDGWIARPIKRWHTLIATCVASLLVTQAHALDQVSLQLKWKHQFQFAGYYAAIEEGFYRENGLEVEIREGGPSVDASATVAAGGADFGVCTNSLLLNKDQRANIIVLAVIFSTPPRSF
jgi:ABC-type nitrate/sulfonate/bicarbonate transport system substrate-binding protein